MSRHSLATKKDIRVGKRVWIHEWDRNTGKLEVKSAILTKHYIDFCGAWVEWAGKKRLDVYHVFGKARCLSMRDRGVRGWNYDNRPCQIFLNKRSAEFWLKHWGDKHPNFEPRNY